MRTQYNRKHPHGQLNTPRCLLSQQRWGCYAKINAEDVSCGFSGGHYAMAEQAERGVQVSLLFESI